jgi:hypothetical protein
MTKSRSPPSPARPGASDSRSASRTALRHSKEAAAAGSVGTSQYLVIGASKYQVRSLTTDPTAPTAATVQVVDPGTSAAAESVQQPPGAAAVVGAQRCGQRLDQGRDRESDAVAVPAQP